MKYNFKEVTVQKKNTGHVWRLVWFLSQVSQILLFVFVILFKFNVQIQIAMFLSTAKVTLLIIVVNKQWR